MSLPARGLYAILDAAHIAPAAFERAAQAAFAGGAVMLQYRDKQSDAQDRRDHAQRLAAVARAAGRPLIVNDDPCLAAEAGAQGVHLGRADAGIEQARDMLGERAIIGATCHASLTHAHAAVAAGADYVSFGRFFASRTKPQASAAPVTVLRRARDELNVPVVAIGGINADNGRALLAAGADLLAASAAVFASKDIEAAAGGLARVFDLA